MQYGDKFHNCLRLPITDDENQDERINAAVAHCLHYGFDNVALMINAEEFNLGHATLDEIEGHVRVLEKAKKKFEDAGISVSVNNWIELGHVGRGRKFKEGQDFTTMVDANGVKNDFVVCPLGENWRKYYVEYVKNLVSRLKPDTFWVEDDFRLHNHPPMTGIGCFCDEHMARFNKRLGTNYTREEFVKKVFAEGEPTKEREVWLDIDGETMYETLKILVDAIKEASPNTDVGIMSSDPAVHCVEGRDWNKFLDVLSSGGTKINRIHLPFYEEASGKIALYDFNRVSMAMRALCPNDTVVLPETEHGSANLYKKSARYLRFTLEAAMPLVLSGMTYSLYDFVANGTRDTFGYGQVVKSQYLYQQAVLDLGLKFSNLKGVIIPIDAKCSYKKVGNGDRSALKPKEFAAAAFIAAQGIAYKYSQDKTFKGETIYLTGSSSDYFTNDQLKLLFADNKIILDGSCVLKLKNRGLLSLIRAKSAEIKAVESGYQTYQQCDDGTVIEGVKNLRASLRLLSCNLVEIEYDGDVSVHTNAYNEYMQKLAPVIVDCDKFTVLPFDTESLDLPIPPLTLFCDLTRHYLTRAVMNYGRDYVVSERAGVNPYLYATDKNYVLMLSNGNVDTYKTTKFRTNVDFNAIKAVRRDGKIESVVFSRSGEWVTIEEPLEYLSTSVYVLEKKSGARKMLVMGDSIAAGTYTGKDDWCPLSKAKTFGSIIAQKLGYDELVNSAVNGITYKSADWGNTAYSVINQEKNSPLCDLVVISAGTNDFGTGVALGEASDTRDVSFIGAVETVFRTISERRKGAKVVIVIPYERSRNVNGIGLTLDDYRKVLIEKAEKYGFIVVHGENLKLGEYEFDGLHPDDEGHRIIAEYILKEIEKC